MKVHNNIQLQNYNSFNTKSIAKLFCEPETQEDISDLLRTYSKEKKLILGAGYNLFFTKDFNGLVIKPSIKGIKIVSEDDSSVIIEAGAGVEWDILVEDCVSKGYAGLENLSLIPSSVGASPIQNIGAYGSEAKDTIILVKTVDLQTGKYQEFTNSECQFGYRNSIFKQTNRYIITSVVFKLSKSFTYKEKYIDLSRELVNIDSPTIKQVRDAIVKIRTRKLPDTKILPNAGSFFKNPVLTEDEKNSLQKTVLDAPIYNIGDNKFKTSAAFLIEKAGFKGKRNGMVGTYEHHALVIVNYGTNNGKEISDFASQIQQEVLKRFCINLEPEVWIF
ncbi:MAG TPA: UDP-N-acetylmuramate dehydrogenase [Bacteroidales bacterium]|nr:UDP-N-acetylmuramate dehydrogenase [Bacteroidales bacterium]